MTYAHPEDVILWPCGTYCLRSELADYADKSDDYQVLPDGSPKHSAFFARLERMDAAPY